MRGTVHNLYALTMRTLALVGLGCVVWLMSSLPSMLSGNQLVGTPFAIAVIAGIISLALLWPYLTPSWLGRPVRAVQVFPLILAYVVLPVMYGFVAMSAIVAADIGPPLANQLAIGLGALLFFTALVALGLGASLCFWARKPRPVAADNVAVFAPIRDASPVEESGKAEPQAAGFRSVRHAG